MQVRSSHPVPKIRKTWLEKYGRTLKILLPFRFGKDKEPNVLHDEKIGCLAYISIHWLNSHMWKASRKTIDEQNIKNVKKHNGVEVNYDKFKVMWEEKFIKNEFEKLTLFHLICKFCKLRLICASIFITCMAIFNYIGPSWILQEMLRCLSDREIPLSEGVIWAGVFSATQLLRHFMFNAYWVTSAYAGLKVVAALQGLVYNKLLRAKTSGAIDNAKIISLYTADIERIYQMIQLMCLAVPPVLIVVTHIVFSYLLIGPWSLLGNVIMIAYAPFMFAIINKSNIYRSKAAKMTDHRIGLTNQLLMNIKFVKIMAWESIFFDKVQRARKEEQKNFEKVIFLQSISWSTIVIAGNLGMMLCIVGKLLSGGVLNSIQILNLMSTFAALSTPLGTVVLALKALSEGRLSCRRVQEFLTSIISDEQQLTSPTLNNISIDIKNLDVGWHNAKSYPLNNNIELRSNGCKMQEIKPTEKSQFDKVLKEHQSVLSEINFSAKKGQLIGICGPIGSGKSTLLASICGSTNILNGKLNVSGSIALVTQQACIFTGTARQNILFGLPFDSEKYCQVVDACCLEKDFRLMANKDQTEIGERGSNLSGGQKQRINLARALYSNRDIYLLDDPLSALDAKVAKLIFKKYIQTQLRFKTVILVTHILQYLKLCDHIVAMDDGKICEQGSHDDLINKQKKYSQMVNQSKEDSLSITKLSSKVAKNKTVGFEILPIDEDAKYDGKMINVEIDQNSSISFKTLCYFAKQCGGYIMSFLVLLSISLFAITAVFNNFWFKFWIATDIHSFRYQIPINSSLNENSTSEQLNSISWTDKRFSLNFAIYVGSVGTLIILAVIKGLHFKKSMQLGNFQLHKKMLWKVIRSSMTFFDSTPLGRVINRFSRDLDEMDVHVPNFAEYVSQTLAIVILQTAIVCGLYPWFTVALAIIICIFILFDKLFSPAVQETKRMDNLLKPPVINHINSTIQGLEVIKCYEQQQSFTETFYNLVEKHLSVYLQYQLSSKWISFRVDIIGWVAITVLAMIIMVTKSEVSTLNGGLSLILVTQACIILSVAMRFKSELEAKLTSLERICDYNLNLVEEAPHVIKDCRPLDDWPSTGRIDFQNVFLKYREDSPFVLKELNLVIGQGEKVGIIGRTGAGKSSILAALLRIVELHSGKILIDNLDISEIGLEDLRSRVAVIPQEPVLLTGSVKWNLDPNDKYSDDDIWKALEKSYLKTKISNEPSQLQTQLQPESGMFSVGEMQLFCLARALLRNSKILILDEATANIDIETDKLIQNSIRNFFGNCTVLSIAHRLNTVMDYDKILTMDSGKVLEFDSPKNLLQIDSHFRSMLNAQV